MQRLYFIAEQTFSIPQRHMWHIWGTMGGKEVRKNVYLKGVIWQDNYWERNLNNHLIDKLKPGHMCV